MISVGIGGFLIAIGIVLCGRACWRYVVERRGDARDLIRISTGFDYAWMAGISTAALGWLVIAWPRGWPPWPALFVVAVGYGAIFLLKPRLRRWSERGDGGSSGGDAGL